MKKIIQLYTIFISLFAFCLHVSAATGNINATVSSKQVTVGSTFTVTVKVSSNEALGSWQYGISYDSAYISLQSGDTTVAAYGDGSIKSKSYTYKFKAIKSGSAGIRVTGASMVSWNDVNTLFTPSVSNASVTIKTQAEIEASYSKDNTLRSLIIEGYQLTPEFNKNTTQYEVEVPDDVTSINVTARVNDANAYARGTGLINVSEGNNKIEVTVTAQNGSIKTYTINVTVKDLMPIIVTLEDKEYTIVKKEALLEIPTGYTKTTIKINDLDIPAFTSELTKFTLVGLKNETGNIKLYIYDENKNSYSLYNEIKSSTLTLYPIKTTEELPKEFKETTIKINDNTYQAFVSPKMTLMYAMNVENGYKGLYIYDKLENSFIRYMKEEKSNSITAYIFILLGIILLLLIITIIMIRKNKKFKKLLTKISQEQEDKPKNKEEGTE